MPKERFKLAAKIRRQRIKQKKAVFTRPAESTAIAAARRRMKSKSRMPLLDKAIKESNKKKNKKR